MIVFEHHLDFCLVGFGQSEQRTSKFCIHVFHQLVFSLLEENHLVEIMNGKPPDVLFLPIDFLPAKKKLIDDRHGFKIWTYAVHFDQSLPDKNPDDFQMQSFLKKMMLF